MPPIKRPRGRPPGKTLAPRAHKPAKEPIPLEPVEEPKPEPVNQKPAVKPSHGHNFYAVGKRKTSVSQILLSSGEGTIVLNNLPIEGYFQTVDLQHIAKQPLSLLGVEKQVNIKGKIHGGGIHSQAESLRHAIARALIQYNPESRRVLKKQGFLTRDPRVKERKKPGLKRARRAPQFSKR